MQVLFVQPQKLGNKNYAKGLQEVPDSLAYNLAFKKLVVSGHIQVMARDEQAQAVLHSRNEIAFRHAQSPMFGKAAEQHQAHKAMASTSKAIAGTAPARTVTVTKFRKAVH